MRNAAVIAAAEMIVRVKGFVVIPLLTHRLGATGYGTWAQVAMLAVLLGPLVMLGTDSGIVRFLPGTDPAERAQRFAGWAIAITAMSLVVCGLVALFRDPLAIAIFGTGGEYARFVPLAAASIMTTNVVNFGRTWFRLENDALRLSAIIVTQAFLSTIALLVWYVLGQSLYALVAYSVLADALLGLTIVMLIAQRIGRPTPDFSIVPQLVRYGVVLLPAGYAIWALNWVDRIFLVHYADLRAVGIYSLAYTLGYLVTQVVVNPIWTMFPNKVAEFWNQGRRAEAQRLFESTAGAVLALSVPAVAGAAVLGDGVLRVLAPAEFGRAAPVLPLVLAGYLCFMLAAFYETVFGLVGKQGLGTVTVGVASASNIALNFLLIPRFSYIGAALATLGGFAIQLVLCMAVNRRLGLLKVPLATPLRVVLASAAMTASLLPLHGLLVDHGALVLLGGILLGASVYLVFCRLFGVLRPGTLGREGRRLLRRKAVQPAQTS